MVDALVRSQTRQHIWLNPKVLPPDVPLRLLLVTCPRKRLVEPLLGLFVTCDTLQEILITLVLDYDAVLELLQAESSENFVVAAYRLSTSKGTYQSGTPSVCTD